MNTWNPKNSLSLLLIGFIPMICNGQPAANKQTLNLKEMEVFVRKNQFTAPEIKQYLAQVSSRKWDITTDDSIISISWTVDEAEHMEYNKIKHTLLVGSNWSKQLNNIINELKINKYKKTTYIPKDGELYKVKFQNQNFSVLCVKEQGGSMGNTPSTIIISRSPSFKTTGINANLSADALNASTMNNSAISNLNLPYSLLLIPKYEKLVSEGLQPREPNVQTKYDDNDFKVILWNDKLYNKTLYNKKNLKDLGYDYIGITEDDNGHITYSYRNCEKNLTLDLTEWYNVKLSIYVSWFSDVVKNSSGRFIGCSPANN